MTRPDEIAALADKAKYYADNYERTNIAQSELREMAEVLRLSATSPGDAVRMKEACKLAVTELDCMYLNGERVPYGGIPADPESSMYRKAIQDAEAAIEALATAAKPGGDTAIELAYGLLWLVGCDRSTPNGNALYLARKALYEKLDKSGQARGITAARQAINDNPYVGGSDGARSFDHILDAGDGVCGRISADAVDEPCGRSGDARAVTGAGHHVASVDSAASTDTAGIQSAAGLDATPTPPSADVAKARVHADRIRWLLDNQPNALSFACEMHARARSIMESLDTLIQSAAPGGGHQSDGGDLSALPSGESEPLVTTASAPSDPAQELEAVALTPEQIFLINDMIHAWVEDKAEYRESFRSDCKRLLATVRPVSLDREAIARIIDPEAKFDEIEGVKWSIADIERRNLAYQKADALEAKDAEIARLRDIMVDAGYLIIRQQEWQTYGEQLERDADAAMAAEIQEQRKKNAALRDRLTSLEHQLAEERERCAKAVYGAVGMIPMGQVDASEFLDKIEDAIAAAIRGGAK